MPAKTNLARVEILMGDRIAANQILMDVLAKQPTAEPALTMVVSGYVQTNKLAEAAGILERAHRADPNQAHITVTLGDVYIRSGMAQEAFGLTAAETGARNNPLTSLTCVRLHNSPWGKRWTPRQPTPAFSSRTQSSWDRGASLSHC